MRFTTKRYHEALLHGTRGNWRFTMAAGTKDTIVLTAEGRRRLDARLAATESELAELDGRLPGSEQRHLDLEERARLKERVDELRATLSTAVTVDAVEEDPTVIEVGDEVDFEYEDGEQQTVVLVHPVEVDPEHGFVSIASPLGEALLGCRVGETVEVMAPGGRYEVRALQQRRSV